MMNLKIHTNGRMRSYVTPNGSGGLFRDWVALSRFSESSPDLCGPMLYLREGERWARIDEDGALDGLAVSLEVRVLPDLDVEVRKITSSNQLDQPRRLEITSYTEISLNHPMGDAGHPAFSKLFVQTSQANDGVLLARRRPRGLNENWPWMAQTLVGEISGKSWETNRAHFIGRGRSPLDPAAMDRQGPLSGNVGNVLDPVMAFRGELLLDAGATETVWIVTAAAENEAAVLDLLTKWDPDSSQSDVETADVTRFEAMASLMISGRNDRVVPTSIHGAEVLHRHPLGGDEIRVIAKGGWQSAGTREALAALPFWRERGLQVRLFVMDAEPMATLPEGVVQVDPSTFSPQELEWWLASAQLELGSEIFSHPMPVPRADRERPSLAADAPADAGEPLLHFNGHGGFSADGREYVIPLPLVDGRLQLPPMPWVNILANPDFGCMVTERGAGYTWARNSQANRLTPWSNDPIRDPHGEALYLKDEKSGLLWSPLPGPCPPQSSFVVRHGFGRSRFISSVEGLEQVVDFMVPPEDRIKLVSVRLKNAGASERRLKFAAYHRLVLCATPDRHHAALAWTDAQGVQQAVNPRAGDFAGGRVFSFLEAHGVAADRAPSNHSSKAFVGTSDLTRPDAMNDWPSAGGFGNDACFSQQLSFVLQPGEEIRVVIALGEVMSEAEEARLVHKYRRADAVTDANACISDYWETMLGQIQIRTPLAEVDPMVNGWLLYQNLACRIWGRSAFYQSGGAYGFRDQLQDSSALATLHPELMRAQILLHAAQQFPEGDVTHWWHPAPMDRGMRTKFSDDLLWLPYLTEHYVRVTGDDSVFDETCAFIEGPLLGPNEDEEYMKPSVSDRVESVFEHCCLAIDRSLTVGEHGLPLMGIGDWNDGMSRIGREGRGESVWMGFFLITILDRWIPLCQSRGETLRADVYSSYRDDLLTALNDAGWDGDWYRRAYYDDGTPLGTHTDDECRIDALAQAWAVISGAAPADRVVKCLDSLERELIDRDHSIIRLLHPPFVNTPHDPGYIKGYVAGVRENGGQYTHAACWVIRAMAEAGRKDEAAALLQRLSPIWHSRNSEAVATYQVEPYVVAADIYGADPHVGRGGWTWYTGSAGWMFRVAVESLLGFRVENGDTLVLDPRVPDSWPGFSVDFKTPSGRTCYRIEAVIQGKADKVVAVLLDGRALSPIDGTARWPIVDDGGEHRIIVTMA